MKVRLIKRLTSVVDLDVPEPTAEGLRGEEEMAWFDMVDEAAERAALNAAWDEDEAESGWERVTDEDEWDDEPTEAERIEDERIEAAMAAHDAAAGFPGFEPCGRENE